MLILKTWHFQPAGIDGKPVAVQGVFELAHNGSAAPPILKEPPALIPAP
jgi:hypothetical protein